MTQDNYLYSNEMRKNALAQMMELRKKVEADGVDYESARKMFDFSDVLDIDFNSFSVRYKDISVTVFNIAGKPVMGTHCDLYEGYATFLTTYYFTFQELNPITDETKEQVRKEGSGDC